MLWLLLVWVFCWCCLDGLFGWFNSVVYVHALDRLFAFWCGLNLCAAWVFCYLAVDLIVVFVAGWFLILGFLVRDFCLSFGFGLRGIGWLEVLLD